MAKQSAKDRSARLAKGCCPIHGLGMCQVGNTDAESGRAIFIAECPRSDCSIQVTAETPFGPAILLPEYSHLLGPVTVAIS